VGVCIAGWEEVLSSTRDSHDVQSALVVLLHGVDWELCMWFGVAGMSREMSDGDCDTL
jgi:hypothetical protein